MTYIRFLAYALFILNALHLPSASANDLTPFQFQTIVNKSNSFEITTKAGFMDSSGRVVIEPIFDDADKFDNSTLAKVKIGSKWGFIDSTGRIAIPPQFENVSRFGADGTALAKVDGLYGFIDEKGNWLIKPIWENAWQFSKAGDDIWLAAVSKNGVWGYINRWGKLVIPLSFKNAWFFSQNGMAPAKSKDQWGFINVEGKFVVEPRFDQVSWNFDKSGIAAASRGDKWGYIDATGSTTINFDYDMVSWFFGPNGETVVSKNDKDGYIDAKGNPLTPITFDYASNFNDFGFALARIDSQYFEINKHGNITSIGYFDDPTLEFSATGLLFVHKVGESCPQVLNRKYEVLPAWLEYVHRIQENNKKWIDKIPVLSLFPCARVMP